MLYDTTLLFEEEEHGHDTRTFFWPYSFIKLLVVKPKSSEDRLEIIQTQ